MPSFNKNRIKNYVYCDQNHVTEDYFSSTTEIVRQTLAVYSFVTSFPSRISIWKNNCNLLFSYCTSCNHWRRHFGGQYGKNKELSSNYSGTYVSSDGSRIVPNFLNCKAEMWDSSMVFECLTTHRRH